MEIETDENEGSSGPSREIFGVTVCGNLLKDAENNGMDKDEINICVSRMVNFFNCDIVKLKYERLATNKITPKIIKNYTILLSSAMHYYGLSEPNVIYNGNFAEDATANDPDLDYDDLILAQRKMNNCTFGSYKWDKERFSAKNVIHLAILFSLILKHLTAANSVSSIASTPESASTPVSTSAPVSTPTPPPPPTLVSPPPPTPAPPPPPPPTPAPPPAVEAAPAAKPATEKVGNIRKCPACGEPVESFQARCSRCGHEFNEVKTSSGVKEFFQQIMQLSTQAETSQTDYKGLLIRLLVLVVIFVGLGIFGFSYYTETDFRGDAEIRFFITLGVIALVTLLIVVASMIKRVTFTVNDNQKKSLIEIFPIPNSREDILEFLVMAGSQILPTHGLGYNARKQQAWNKVWDVKCRQVFTKADIVFTGVSQSQATVTKVRGTIEKTIAEAKKRAVVSGLVAAVAVAAVLIGIPNGIGYYLNGNDISIPATTVIPPEQVAITGTFGDLFRATGTGITITSQGINLPVVTIEIEALRDIDGVVEQAARRAAQERRWNWEYCSYAINEYSDDFILDGLGNGVRANFKNAPFLSMKTGDIQTIPLSFSFPGPYNRDRLSTREKRAESVQIMNTSQVLLTLSLKYRCKLYYRHPNEGADLDYFDL